MKTKRLVIEELQPSHADQLFEALQDQRLYQYIPELAPTSIDALRRRYSQLVAGPSSAARERWLNWVMFDASSGAPVGTLQATVWRAEHLALLAYVVFPAYWQRGFAGEGAAWLVDHLHSNEAVHVVRATVDSRNTASLGVLRRLGFTLTTSTALDPNERMFEKHLKPALRSSITTRRDPSKPRERPA